MKTASAGLDVECWSLGFEDCWIAGWQDGRMAGWLDRRIGNFVVCCSVILLLVSPLLLRQRIQSTNRFVILLGCVFREQCNTWIIQLKDITTFCWILPDIFLFQFPVMRKRNIPRFICS